MMPRLNNRKVVSPPSGRSASAACEGRLDVDDSRQMQRGRRAQNDEKRDQIRKTHSQVGIPADAAQMLPRDLLRVGQQ